MVLFPITKQDLVDLFFLPVSQNCKLLSLEANLFFSFFLFLLRFEAWLDDISPLLPLFPRTLDKPHFLQTSSAE